MPSESAPPESADVGNPEVATEDAELDAPGGFIRALLLRDRDGASDEEEQCGCSEEDGGSQEGQDEGGLQEGQDEGGSQEGQDEGGPSEGEQDEGGLQEGQGDDGPSEGEQGRCASAERQDPGQGGRQGGRPEGTEERPDSRAEGAEGQQELRPEELREGLAEKPATAKPQSTPAGDAVVPSTGEVVAKDVAPHPGERQQRLSYAKHGLRDEDVAELRWPEERYGYQELDFSSNQLTEQGLRPILGLGARCGELRVLKLFRNRIGDEGARLLADFFEQCPSIREVHLSHNRLTEKGIETIVAATQRSRPSGSGPLWLRVEYNSVVDQRSLLRDLEARHGVCPRREACSQFRCSIGSKVHLPFLDMNRERQDKDNARRDIGLRRANSPRVDAPRRLPQLLPCRDPRSRDWSPSRGTSHDSRGGRHGHHQEVKEDLRRDLGLRAVDSPHRVRELLPSKRPKERSHGSRSGKRGHRLEARSLTPPRRQARSRSRCRRTRRRDGSNHSHRGTSKPRSLVCRRRVKRTRRRAGSDASCHANGHDGSGRQRKRISQRSGGVHGHRDRPADPPPVVQEPQLESKELQERLNRLLGRL